MSISRSRHSSGPATTNWAMQVLVDPGGDGRGKGCRSTCPVIGDGVDQVGRHLELAWGSVVAAWPSRSAPAVHRIPTAVVNRAASMAKAPVARRSSRRWSCRSPDPPGSRPSASAA